MSEPSFPLHHPALVAIILEAKQTYASLTEKHRLDGNWDVVEALYEITDILDATNPHDPELSVFDLKAIADQISEINQSIQARFFHE